MTAISFDNHAVQSYIFYSAILVLKILTMAPITVLTRILKGTYANPEDAKMLAGTVKSDERVERFRRAHRNDLENIPAFWILGALYLTTGPNVVWASLLFGVYTAARVSHTIFHAIIPVLPLRALSWTLALVIMIYMSLQVLFHYITAL